MAEEKYLNLNGLQYYTRKLDEKKANLESPVFTGTPTAPTADNNNNSNQIATTAFVKNQNFLTEHQSLEGKQDTIEDLETIRNGAALGATSIQDISMKANIESPEFTGTPTAPTPDNNSNNTSIATTAFVKTVANDKMDKINPTGTGSFSLDRREGSAIGTGSISIGENSMATEYFSAAIGGYSSATGQSSMAIGQQANAIGNLSFSGPAGKAIGDYSFSACEGTSMGNHSVSFDSLSPRIICYSNVDNKVEIVNSRSMIVQYNGSGDEANLVYNSNLDLLREDLYYSCTLAYDNGHLAFLSIPIKNISIYNEEENKYLLTFDFDIETEKTLMYFELQVNGEYGSIGNYSFTQGLGNTVKSQCSGSLGIYTYIYFNLAEAYTAKSPDLFISIQDGGHTNSYFNLLNTSTDRKINGHRIKKVTKINSLKLKLTSEDEFFDHDISAGNSINIFLNNVIEEDADASFMTGSGNVTKSQFSFVSGYLNSIASNNGGHITGIHNVVTGDYSCAEGCYNVASGPYSHVEGGYSNASGQDSHAEGLITTASETASHAEGRSSKATAYAAHAEGRQTLASGQYSHSEGYSTTASAESSHAGGIGTKASCVGQTAIGKYNVSDNSNYVFIVGNGESDTTRSNALTIDWQGNLWIPGNIYTGGTNQSSANIMNNEYNNIILTSPNGNKFSLSVNDNGILQTELVTE